MLTVKLMTIVRLLFVVDYLIVKIVIKNAGKDVGSWVPTTSKLL